MTNDIHDEKSLREAPAPPAVPAPTRSRQKAAQKRLVIYMILFFLAAIIVVLAAFLPRLLYVVNQPDGQSELQSMIIEGDSAAASMERLQNEIRSLRQSLDKREVENAELRADLDVLRRQAAEHSQYQVNAEAVISRYEEDARLLENKLSATTAAVRLISAFSLDDMDAVRDYAHMFDNPEALSLLDSDIREIVEAILDALAQ